jgi:hypothetical protein
LHQQTLSLASPILTFTCTPSRFPRLPFPHHRFLYLTIASSTSPIFSAVQLNPIVHILTTLSLDLVTYCVNEGVPFTEFEDWSSILASVKAIVAGEKTVQDVYAEGVAEFEGGRASTSTGEVGA